MVCVDLTKEISITSPEDSTGLCAVCQQIDFASLTRGGCAYNGNDPHFHIGPLRHVASKTFCPGCRLISSAVGVIEPSGRTLGEQKITIRRKDLMAQSRRPEDTKKTFLATEDGYVAITTSTGRLHMEGLIEVELTSNRVKGTIIKSECHETSENFQPTRKTSSGEDSGDRFSIRGRAVQHIANFGLIRDWIQSCDSQHDRCSLRAKRLSGVITIRLIDVQGKMIVSVSQGVRYVALSYVWGQKTAPMLTRNTLPLYSSPNSLQDSMIPETILNAIQLVSAVGERYLWVDSLCIVQDDDNDKLEQLAIMDSIFQCASLVVVAAAGRDAYAGLPGIGKTKRRTSQQSEVINGSRFMTTKPSVRQVLDGSKWNTRGWTFQELMLARRILVFAEGQVYWNCQTASWREDATCESDVAALTMDATNSPWFSFPKGEACRTRIYCDFVDKFSGREFKEQRDVLWAFLSILRLQESQFPQGFLWGLPLEELDATLLWFESVKRHGMHTRQSPHSVPEGDGSLYLPYPSWSWLSTMRNVNFIDPCGGSVVSEVKWHEPLKIEGIYFNPISSDGSCGTNVDQKANISAALSVAGKSIVEYGFLQFTAQTAELCLREEVDVNERYTFPLTVKRPFSGNAGNASPSLGKSGETMPQEEDRVSRYKPPPLKSHWVLAKIYIPSGGRIGQILVPRRLFDGGREILGEFVLLSTNYNTELDKTFHAIGKCRPTFKYMPTHNIMLIEWIKDIAYRRGLTTVGKGAWAKVRTHKRRIILG